LQYNSETKTIHMRNSNQFAVVTVIFCVAGFAGNPAKAQDYIEKATLDSITIEYKWSGSQALKKDSPEALFLQVTNQGTLKKLVSFELLYYQTGVLQSRSGIKEYCIKPGQTIRGKRWNLVFESVGNMADADGDSGFSWELDNLTVEQNKTCDTGLRWRLAPEHPTHPAGND